jgi:GAF domain-containing protein
VNRDSFQAITSLRNGLDRAVDIRAMFRVAIETLVSNFNSTKAIAIVYPSGGGESSAVHREVVGNFRTEEIDAVFAASRSVADRFLPECREHATLVPVTTGNRCSGVLYTEGPPDRDGLVRATIAFVAGVLAEAIERRQLVDKGGEIDAFTVQELTQSVLLDSILDQIVDEFRLEFAAISLVDFDQRRISMVRTRNVAPGWRRTVDYSLSHEGVQTWVISNKKSFKSDNGKYHPLFDRHTWDKYVHKDLARFWSPILADNLAIGTIEAGCHIGWAHELLTDDVCARIEAIGREQGGEIAKYPSKSRRFRLLAEETTAAAGALGCLLLKYLPESDQDLMVIKVGEVPSQLPVIVRYPHGKQYGSDIVEEGLGGLFARVHEILIEGARCVFALIFRDREAIEAGNNRQAEAFLSRMKVAVRAAHLREHLAEVRDRSERLSGLHALIGQTATGSPIEKAMEEIAQRAIAVLDADTIGVYQYSRDRREPWQLLRHYGVLRAKQVNSDFFPRRIFEGLGNESSLFVPDVANNALLGQGRPGERLERFAVREGIVSAAIVTMRGPEELEAAGLLFVNYRTRRAFPPRERHEIEAIANSIWKIIQVHRYRDLAQERLVRRDAELDALKQLDEILFNNLETVDLSSLCGRLLGVIVSIIHAPVGCLLWEETPGGDLEFRASHGFPPKFAGGGARWRRDDGLIGDVVRSGQYKIVPRTSEEPRYLPSNGILQSELIVPIKEGERVVGVINLEHSESEKFGEEDARLLTLFAARLMFAHHIATLYKRINDQIQPRQTMGIIATRMQEPHRSLDSLLRLVLTGITCGQGLKFSRAMLLLMDEEGALLKGRMAIGAMNRTEAFATWEELRQRMAEAQSSSFDDVLRWIIARADALSAGIESGEITDCPLSTTIQQIEIPLKGSQSSLYDAISRCIDKSEPVHVPGTQDDWLKRYLSAAARIDSGHYAFDCVPLFTSGKPFGVIVVDNRFQEGLEESRMNPEELRTLETFAELAAMSIDNRRRGRIEMYRAIAHQIKRPINQAHRLLEPGFEHLSPPTGAMVSSLIAKAARTAASSSWFADMAEGRPPAIDLSPESPSVLLHLVESLVREFQATSPPVTFKVDDVSFVSLADRQLNLDTESMMHVLSNILENACVYAHRNTPVLIGAGVTEKGEFRIRVTNRGNQLGPEVTENAVKMNWRDAAARKVNPAGAGLGLWVANEFIKAHFGHFCLESGDGQVTASIFLPM